MAISTTDRLIAVTRMTFDEHFIVSKPGYSHKTNVSAKFNPPPTPKTLTVSVIQDLMLEIPNTAGGVNSFCHLAVY